MPLLWAIPLGLYLLSFIMVFARWPILKWLWLLRIFQAAGLAGAAATVYLGGLKTDGIVAVGALHLAAFFLTALVCHGAMAADRPASKHLTEYYLWMSAGGVVGGLLCALVAPLVFNSVLEYPLMLVAACLLRPPPRSSRYERFWRWSDLALMLMQGCVFAFAAGALSQGRLADMAANWSSEPLKKFALDDHQSHGEDLAGSSWRGSWPSCCSAAASASPSPSPTLLVRLHDLRRPGRRPLFGAELLRRPPRRDRPLRSRWRPLVYHTLMHGSTMHGQQSRDPDDALDPWTYYHRSGPVGDVFDALEHREAFLRRGHIGVVGLGTGSVAAYAQARADAHLFRDRRGRAADRAGPRVLHVSHRLPRDAARSAWAMPG